MDNQFGTPISGPIPALKRSAFSQNERKLEDMVGQVDGKLSGYVTLATDQTITGNKTFTPPGDMIIEPADIEEFPEADGKFYVKLFSQFEWPPWINKEYHSPFNYVNFMAGVGPQLPDLCPDIGPHSAGLWYDDTVSKFCYTYGDPSVELTTQILATMEDVETAGGTVTTSEDDETPGHLDSKLVAGTGVTLTESEGAITVAVPNDHASGSDNQNLFATVAGDSGSATADSETDTLTVAGSNGVATSVSGDTLTVGLSSSASATLTGLTLSGLTAGSVLFAGTGGVISQDNSNLAWHNASKYLGVGTNAPSYARLHVAGDTAEKCRIKQQGTANVSVGHNFRRDESGGSYNCSWFCHVPASSTNLAWNHGSVDRFYMTTGGALGIGATPNASRLHLYASGTTPLGYGIMTMETQAYHNEIYYNTYSDTAIHHNAVRCIRYRGTKASPSAVQDGDNIGSFLYNGYDGTDILYRAGFKVVVSGTVSTGVCPLDIVFETNSSASASGSERMRIASDGKVSVEEMLHAKSGVRTIVSTADVSSPPTDSELDSAFGAPADVGAGFVGIVNDNDAGTAEYICWSDGTNWFYTTGTKAV